MSKFTIFVSLLTAISSTTLVPQNDERIVGGQNANIVNFPYQLSFQSYGSHFCGASILSPRWVVTAAHCTEGLSSRGLSIVAGISSLRETGQRIPIVRIHQHPAYRSSTTDYDISILQLAHPLRFNPKTRPITLPRSAPIRGTPVICTGWGSLREGGGSVDQLQKVQLAIVDRDICRRQYGFSAITDRMICAGVPGGGKDACQGDSGGPLVANGLLLGIVSWGNGCGRPNFSGVYSNVAELRGFIREKTGL